MDNNKCYLGALQTYDILGFGSFSTVYSCDFYEALYAYKEYRDKNFVSFIQPRLEQLTHFYNDKRFVFPYKLIYSRPTDDKCLGVVLDYLYNYQKLCDLDSVDYEKKLELLKRTRDLLNSFHDEYNLLHADVNPWNILYNDKYDNLKLIDFDVCIDLKNKPDSLCNYYNEYAHNYSKYVGIDKDLDIFLFNLTTISILTDVDFNSLFKIDMNDKIKNLNSEFVSKVFDGYKNLECNKSLKKEYVIDYL